MALLVTSGVVCAVCTYRDDCLKIDVSGPGRNLLAFCGYFLFFTRIDCVSVLNVTPHTHLC